jgi:cytochrome c
LIGGEVTISTNYLPVKQYPFATTVWDYINRAMPLHQSGLLTVDEVYAVTAFLLQKNGIIKENDAMNAQTLPKVVMPSRSAFVPPNADWKPGVPRPFKIDPSK